MLDFNGKTVLVTGGSRGIGAASVRAFMERGANVAFTYNKNYRAADSLAQSCEKYPGDVYFAECDVSDYTEVQLFLEKSYKKFHPIDILVNNAGIWNGASFEEITVDIWRKMLQINLDSVFYFSTLVSRHMIEEKRKGAIINLSSTAGQRGEKYHAHYAATKGGIISYSKSLAQEVGPLGIRVNCIAPGWVNTDMSADAIKKDDGHILNEMPLGFIPEAVDIANGIVFLASDMARAITGEVLNINAGSVLFA